MPGPTPAPPPAATRGRLLTAASLALLGAGGCASTHSLTPLALETVPSVKIRKDAEFNPSAYRTFAVVPFPYLDASAVLRDEAEYRPLLFALRSRMERLGYAFTPLDGAPDLLVTVDGSIETGKRDHPKELLAPDLARGMTADPARAAALLTPESAAQGWGTYNPTVAYLSPIPGFPPRAGTGPGDDVRGFSFVTLTVGVIDTRTWREVWTGAGAGVARSPNLLVAGQSVLWSTVSQFPRTSRPTIHASAGGIPGLDVESFTNDGEVFFPSVIGIRPGSPAWVAGVRPWDMILATDGTSTANLTAEGFLDLLEGGFDAPISMILWRNGEQIHTRASRVPHTDSPAPAEPRHHLLIPPSRTVTSSYTIPLFGAVILGTIIAFATA